MYKARLLALLGEKDPLEVLSETPLRLQALAPRLDPNRAYGPGKWTVKEVVAHLADTEIGYGFRLRQVAAGVREVQPFDQEAWARGYRALPWPLPLESFLALRRWNLAFLESLPQEAWGMKALHPERGEESLKEMVRLWAGHDLNHLAQILSTL